MTTAESVVSTAPVAASLAKTTVKHSMCFYVSARSLCNNKRLKQKRLKWAKYISPPDNKTEPTLYINLLSDEEDVPQPQHPQQQYEQYTEQINTNYSYERALMLKPISRTEPPPLVPISAPTTTPNNFQPVLVYQQHGDHVSNVPQIAYIPVPPLTVGSYNNMSTPTTTAVPAKKRRKNATITKFKPPTIVNECIVLSDDEDAPTTACNNYKHNNNNNNSNNNNNNKLLSKQSPVIPLLPELTLTAIRYQQNSNSNSNNHNMSNHSDDSFSDNMQEFLDINVNNAHEEVTVSLVPRKIINLSAQSPEQIKNEIDTNENDQASFPMLPDETTVHTVIADRIYEMPLTKLREGLVHGQGSQTIGCNNSNNTIVSQAPPISLKLSSDLSISLISDDETDEPELDKDLEARLSAEKLRRTQPQLSVQEVNLVGTSPSNKPKRRKLG